MKSSAAAQLLRNNSSGLTDKLRLITEEEISHDRPLKLSSKFLMDTQNDTMGGAVR